MRKKKKYNLSDSRTDKLGTTIDIHTKQKQKITQTNKHNQQSTLTCKAVVPVPLGAFNFTPIFSKFPTKST